MEFSIIVPVYNRPDEVRELLESLLEQDYPRFEVVIVEDGSQVPCRSVVNEFADKLDINYIGKENTGPGLTRNAGIEAAKYDYFIFFDSDVIVPQGYLRNVSRALKRRYTDSYGGPDMAHDSFTTVQKAINYAMTSFLTTGGIRGGAKSMEQFKPRSFNMGYSRYVYERIGGFSGMRFGEDIDMSLRIHNGAFEAQLIREAGVYHKRRTDFGKFFKQVHNSGIARINLFVKYPYSLKAVHMLPAVFTVGLAVALLAGFWLVWLWLAIVAFAVVLFADALRLNGSVAVALYAVPASFIQLTGYGTGFLRGVWHRLILGKQDLQAFKNNFYK